MCHLQSVSLEEDHSSDRNFTAVGSAIRTDAQGRANQQHDNVSGLFLPLFARIFLIMGQSRFQPAEHRPLETAGRRSAD